MSSTPEGATSIPPLGSIPTDLPTAAAPAAPSPPPPPPPPPTAALTSRRITLGARQFLPVFTTTEVYNGGSPDESVAGTVAVREIGADERDQGPPVVSVSVQVRGEAVSETGRVTWGEEFKAREVERDHGRGFYDMMPRRGFGPPMEFFLPPPILHALDARYQPHPEAVAARQKAEAEEELRASARTGLLSALRAWMAAERPAVVAHARAVAEYTARRREETDRNSRITRVVDELRRHGGLDVPTFEAAFYAMTPAQRNLAGRALTAVLNGQRVRVGESEPEVAALPPDVLAGAILTRLGINGPEREALHGKLLRLGTDRAAAFGVKVMETASAFAQGVKPRGKRPDAVTVRSKPKRVG